MKRPNIPLLIASVGLSVLFWLHVQSEQALRVTRAVDLPLMAIQLDEKKLIVRSLPKTVRVFADATVENHEKLKALLAARKSDAALKATVDLREAKPEVGSYRVRLPQHPDLNRLEIEWGEVPDIAISVQEIEEKVIEVEAVPTNVPAGFVYSQSEVTPRTVTIRGSQSDLLRVHQVRALIDLKDHKPGQSLPARVEALDEAMRPLVHVTASPETVEVYPVLAQAPPERSLVVAVRFAPNTTPAVGHRLVGYSVNPVTVTVQGNLNTLQKLASINTELVRLDGLTGRTVRRIRLIEPAGTQLRTDRVEVVIQIEAIPTIVAPTQPPATTNGNP